MFLVVLTGLGLVACRLLSIWRGAWLTRFEFVRDACFVVYVRLDMGLSIDGNNIMMFFCFVVNYYLVTWDFVDGLVLL